jgi:SpoVK/Ycf46/Vps4 family AAA+-type ATPase
MGKGYAVDLMAVSLATPGLSGAELEFVVNEAAINAVRRLSSSMKEKKGSGYISSTPRILPTDFEASVKNFYKTRRPPSMKGLIENVFGTKV